MNKKGFTLIEIIAIIILLSVIALITYPIINNLITDSKDELYDKQISELVRLSNTWVTKNITKLKMTDGYTYNLSFDELYEQGFVSDEQVKNPKTGQNLSGCMKVIYNSSNNGYDVSYDESCTTSGEVVKALYSDNSGANKPELFNNMIAIKYENNKWIVADLYSKWYDYDSKEWANAVVLNSGVTKNVGDEVTEEDIALWYVWIPRYKYTIFNGNNGSAAAQLINVTFESGTARTGTVTCSDNADGSETCSTITNGTSTYTHPAFKFGNTELTGFWVGKFEISTTDSTCNSSASSTNCNKVLTMSIKPNVSSWRYATISNHFTSIQNAKTTYGISNADSHMLKNMEWGAVAYLKQSKYGLGTTDIAVNDNSSYYTGGGTSDAYKTNVAQSTTGNIYGVYDMSGGAYEYVMSNMKNSSNAFYSNGSGFTTTPDAKYYDSYKYDTSNTSYARGKLGDATKETLATFGNPGGGWYSDYAFFPLATINWFFRGGYYDSGASAGVFYFDYSSGNYSRNVSARAVLSAQ